MSLEAQRLRNLSSLNISPKKEKKVQHYFKPLLQSKTKILPECLSYTVSIQISSLLGTNVQYAKREWHDMTPSSRWWPGEYLTHAHSHTAGLRFNFVMATSWWCLSPNKIQTSVYGYLCPGDMIVRIRMILARPWDGVTCFRFFSISTLWYNEWHVFLMD